jgi:hypothetical protein
MSFDNGSPATTAHSDSNPFLPPHHLVQTHLLWNVKENNIFLAIILQLILIIAALVSPKFAQNIGMHIPMQFTLFLSHFKNLSDNKTKYFKQLPNMPLPHALCRAHFKPEKLVPFRLLKTRAKRMRRRWPWPHVCVCVFVCLNMYYSPSPSSIICLPRGEKGEQFSGRCHLSSKKWGSWGKD